MASVAGAKTRMLDDTATGERPARIWLRERVRLVPGSMGRAAPEARRTFGSVWAPVARYGEAVRRLPDELWAFLLGGEGGYVAIRAGDSHYRPGPAQLRGRDVSNVAYVSIDELAQGGLGPLQVLGHLIDHHLGCAGQPAGRWLSDGGGLTPGWCAAAERLPGLFALGYGIDPVARSSQRGYFARSLAWFCRDRQALNVSDPQMERWLRNTIWSPAFWRQAAHPEGG